MARFKTELDCIAKRKGRIILANDYDLDSVIRLERKSISNIKKLSPYLCAIKLNFHLLLPLGKKQICKITDTAHKSGILTIADIKLNDIGNTNDVTTSWIWDMGFDAIIVNPIMGFDNYKRLVSASHKRGKGVISICHMSAPGSRLSYDMDVKVDGINQKLYELLLDWAIKAKADGVVVGATYPEIIEHCKKTLIQSVGNRKSAMLNIVSPGVGIQGGDARAALLKGSDYLIVGRSILNAKSPVSEAQKLQKLTL